MVKTWHSEEQGEVVCKKCGAVYIKTIHRLPARDSDSFHCVACEELIESWNSTSVPEFKRKPIESPLVRSENVKNE